MFSTVTRRQILKKLFGLMRLIAVAPVFILPANTVQKGVVAAERRVPMQLPEPRKTGGTSFEEALNRRRTVRSFTSGNLTLDQLSQLLFAAQGITDDRGVKRAAPSGGALYPMDVYVVAGINGVQGLKEGIYRYEPPKHTLLPVEEGDFRRDVAGASLHQTWMAVPPLSLVITAEYSRITRKYGERGVRYAMMEAGHIGQNIFLQAEALGMSAGIVGAFDDEQVIRVLGIPASHEPLLIMPVGYKR